MIEVTWWALLGVALIEAVAVAIAGERRRREAWRCGKAEAQLTMMRLHLMRIIQATRAYEAAISAIDIQAALDRRSELLQVELAAEALLSHTLQGWRHPKRGSDYYLLARGVRMNMSTSVCDGTTWPSTPTRRRGS